MKKYLNIYVTLYLLVGIFGALVTLWFNPWDLGIVSIPPSSWLMGFSFLLITIIQDRSGSSVASKMIWILLACTAVVCLVNNYSQMIVVASGVAFLVGQYVTKIMYSLHVNRTASSMSGSVVDAAIWILLGLSPIGIGTVPWEMYFRAVWGQVVIQIMMQVIAAQLYNRVKQG